MVTAGRRVGEGVNIDGGASKCIMNLLIANFKS